MERDPLDKRRIWEDIEQYEMYLLSLEEEEYYREEEVEDDFSEFFPRDLIEY